MSPKPIREDSLERSRHEALLESELKIHNASRDTLDSIRTIGRELNQIFDGRLWEVAGQNDFKEYVEIRLQMDYVAARRMMISVKALELLEERKLQLPANASQVIELAKVKEPDTLVNLWGKITDYSHEEHIPVTFAMVRDAVIAQRSATGQFKTRARPKKAKVATGIEVDLKTDSDTPPPKISLSEAGEKALNRIRRLCGAASANAIENENPKISEADLIRWAEQEPEMVKNLAYWMIIKRWSLRKSLAYENQSIDVDTTVTELGDLARSRGGHVYVECGDILITVDIGKSAP